MSVRALLCADGANGAPTEMAPNSRISTLALAAAASQKCYGHATLLLYDVDDVQHRVALSTVTHLTRIDP